MKTKLGRLIYKISIIMINCIMIICLIIPTDFVYATNVVSNNNASEKKQLEVKAETFNNKYNLTEEDLFFKYPNYLNNQAEKILFKNINTDLSNAINGLSKTDDFLGAYLTGLANGTSIILQELSHSLGIGDSYYQTHRKQVIKNLIQSYLNSSNYSNEIGSFLPDYFKDIRNIYSNTEYLTSSELKSELIEINSNFSINEQLTNEQINKLVDIVYENDNLLTAANIYEKGITNAQVIASLFQVYTAEKEFICQISQYIDSKEIQQDLSDYYDEISADFPTRVLNLLKSKVSLESVASFTLKLCEIASNTSLEWPTYAFTKLFVSLAIKYLPLPATGDEIIDATISYSICTSLKTSIDQLKSNFKINKGTKQEMKDFGILYNFYLSSLKNCLNTTKELTTNQYKEVFNNWIKLLENSYSYNTFVKNCLMSITNDIDAGIIERPENIDNYVPKEDENYKENILKRFQAIQAKYPPNQNVQWLGNHGGATQCFGFARMVFSLLFGCEMPTNYKGTEKEAYAYRQSTNVNIVGQLVESQVTETNLKNLFSKGALGDIVQMYGGPAGYRSPHTMILVGLSSSGNGIIVYDCNSARNGQAVNSCYINQYEISFSELAKNYSISDSISKAGITLYRATNYTEIYGEGILFYDDSINFVIENGVLIKYNGWQSHVIVPDEVVEIGEGAFENNNNIVSVTLPLGIKKIHDDAFRNCTRLSYINFPEGLTSIGDYAFQNCTSLLSFVAPSSLKEIGFSAFADCSLLGYVNIINTKIEMLSSYLFENCESLTSIDIPNTVTEIGTFAFMNTSLNKLAIPQSVTTLGGSMIYGNKNIKEMNIPKSVSYVKTSGDGSPFAGSAVESIIFEDGMTKIPDHMCTNTEELMNVDLPDTVVEIGLYSFSGCPSLKNISLPDNLKTLETGAFSDSGLISIEIPDTVTEIGTFAFMNTSLNKLAIPQSVTTLGGSMIYGNKNIKEMNIPKSVSYVKTSGDGSPFAGSAVESIIFEDGMTKIPDHMCTNTEELMNVDLPDTVVEIGLYSFSGCPSLKNISLPDNLKTLETGAFSDSGLISIEIPDTVTEIGTFAFMNTSLNKLAIPQSVTTLGGSMIYGNKNIKEMNIPKSVSYVKTSGDGSPFAGSAVESIIFEDGMTKIPDHMCTNTEELMNVDLPDTVVEIGLYSFSECPSLKNISLPDNLKTLETGAFSDSGLISIEIPDTVTEIRSYAFENCKKLTSAALSDKINTIESSTFVNCSSLSNVKIPNSVVSFKSYAFENCLSLSNIKIPNSVISIESHAFENCDSLTNIEIPNSVEEIQPYAFHDCDSLENVSLGTGITTIPSYCFSHCDSLKDMHLPYRVTTIEENAFSLCTSLSSIYIPRTVTNIENNVFSYPSKITIYGIKDSYAETYANDNDIKFVEKSIHAEEIILDKTEINLLKGQKDKLNLTIKPLDFTDQVTWKSSNSDIVEVDDNGNIVAKNTGKATIKVSVGDKSVSCSVIVNEPIDDIYLNETYLSLDALEKFQLEARIYPEDAFNQSLEWSSSNEKVASVDQTGLITTHSKGKAVITVKALDGSNITASCTVNVKNNGYVVNNIDDFESPHNYENDCNDFWIYHSDTAESLQILFDEKTYFEDNFDYLYIYDGHNNLIGKYTGNELSDKSILVEDNTIKFNLLLIIKEQNGDLK